MIELKNVSKYYGKLCALNQVSFSIEKGDIIGFIGPNGAGKSTAMNLMAGCLSATSGDCVIDGLSISENPVAAKKLIGYLPEQPPLYSSFSVYEYLSCVFDIKQIKMDKKKHIQEIAEFTGILEVLGRNCNNLSKGYRQRTGIAYAMLGYPEYMILDEPTSGLDPKQKREMLDFIKKLSERCGILLSSHILSEIEDVCNKLIMINNGKIVNAVDRMHSGDTQKYLYRIEGNSGKILSVMNSCEGVCGVQHGEDDTYVIEATRDGVGTLFYALAKNHLLILQQQPYTMDVEKIFLDTIQKEK